MTTIIANRVTTCVLLLPNVMMLKLTEVSFHSRLLLAQRCFDLSCFLWDLHNIV